MLGSKCHDIKSLVLVKLAGNRVIRCYPRVPYLRKETVLPRPITETGGARKLARLTTHASLSIHKKWYS